MVLVYQEDGRLFSEELDEAYVYYTDGSCRQNGRLGARSGCGVYAGERLKMQFPNPEVLSV